MKILDTDDLNSLRSLDCLEELMFYGFVNEYKKPVFPYYYGYQLYTWEYKKPYADNDHFIKKCIMSLFPKQKVRVKTPYLFMVRMPDLYYWCTLEKQSSSNWYDGNINPGYTPVSFEEVFENVPEELKEKLIYHINIFRS